MLRSLMSSHACAVAAAMLLLAFPGFAQDVPRKIAIEIVGKAEFDVIYHRALSNATGAVLGGLIGAGIQAGIGWKKNGFGQNTADIATSQPVDQIVESTIDKALVDSRHSVGEGSYSVGKAAALEKTWSGVMGNALDKLIEELVLDEELADAVKAHVAR